MREENLLPPLIRRFGDLGWRTIAEVPVAGRRADLVALSDQGLVAVELKLRRWREALRQATAYQVWAPYAYVALPFANAFTAHRHRHRFEAEGVGLFGILGEDVRTFLPAMASPRLFPALAEHMERRLAGPEALDILSCDSSENVFMRGSALAGGGPDCRSSRPCPKGRLSARPRAARTL